MKKSPLKRGISTLKRGGKLKAKQLTPQQKEQRQADIDRMHKLFAVHWALKPHICESCGDKIWGENNSMYHDHLLEKNKYPKLKYEIQNLLLVCSNCHSLKTAGYPLPKHQEAINRVKIKYGI